MPFHRLLPRALVVSLGSLGVLASAACGTPRGTGVDVTVTHDALSSPVADLEFVVLGDNTNKSTWSVPLAGRQLAETERIVYRPAVTSGRLTMSVAALDDAQAVVACAGPVDVEVFPDRKSAASLVLGPCGLSGVDLSGLDLSGLDLSGLDLAGTDAALPDAAIADASDVDAAIRKVCPSDALLCADFEAGSLTAGWSGTADTSTLYTITLDANRSYEGGHSAHLHLTAPTSGQAFAQPALVSVRTFPPPVYVRAYVYGNTSSVSFSGTLVYLRDDTTNGGLISLGLNGGALRTSSIYLTPPATAPGSTSTTLLHPNAWNCVEWVVDAVPPGQPGGNFHVLLDGASIPALDSTPVSLNSLTTLRVGIETNISAGNDIDLWYDGIAVANHPLGCP